MAVTSLLEVNLKPDSLDEGMSVLHDVLAETRAFDGCLGVTVIQDSTDPTRLVAVEQWESLEKDAAYREWRAGEGAATALAPLLTGPPALIVGEPRDDI
jgi:heme oxygenase (mycobilin-producing)